VRRNREKGPSTWSWYSWWWWRY